MSRTKILATLGPATNDSAILQQLIANGLDAVRVNFSHGKPEDHEARVKMVRDAAEEQGRIIGILADLQGPKIRISKFKEGKVILNEGAPFILDAELDKNSGDVTQVGIDYETLPQDVKPNDVLLLDDGRLVLIANKVEGSKIYCTVKIGGELSNNKGINRKGGGLSAPALTEKDKEDLKVAISLKVDMLAISFPRSAADIEEARKLMEQEGGDAAIIAKIERLEAVEPDALDGIIDASDGIMVARGDLGVEIGVSEVPAAQKYMIKRARARNKMVITATQMMETMITNAIPTRAEVSDVANAVLDGTDAVMLSGETAVGKYPALVVKTMHDVCASTEKHPVALGYHRYDGIDDHVTRVDETVCAATMFAANHLKVKAVVVLTESGRTPLWMSRVRSDVPIYGLSRNLNSLGKMTLYSNVHPVYFDVTKFANGSQVKREAIKELEKRNLVQKGDLIIVTKGQKEGIGGGTNSMTIIKVGGTV